MDGHETIHLSKPPAALTAQWQSDGWFFPVRIGKCNQNTIRIQWIYHMYIIHLQNPFMFNTKISILTTPTNPFLLINKPKNPPKKNGPVHHPYPVVSSSSDFLPHFPGSPRPSRQLGSEHVLLPTSNTHLRPSVPGARFGNPSTHPTGWNLLRVDELCGFPLRKIWKLHGSF